MKNISGRRTPVQKVYSKPKSGTTPAKEGRKQLAGPYKPVRPPQKPPKK